MLAKFEYWDCLIAPALQNILQREPQWECLLTGGVDLQAAVSWFINLNLFCSYPHGHLVEPQGQAADKISKWVIRYASGMKQYKPVHCSKWTDDVCCEHSFSDTYKWLRFVSLKWLPHLRFLKVNVPITIETANTPWIICLNWQLTLPKGRDDVKNVYYNDY